MGASTICARARSPGWRRCAWRARRQSRRARRSIRRRRRPRRLHALADALDAWEARLDAAQRLVALERRHDDLVALASDRRPGDAAVAARKARATAVALSDDALGAYERALDGLRDELAKKPGGRVGPRLDPAPNPGGPCDPHDPLCGLDGRHL